MKILYKEDYVLHRDTSRRNMRRAAICSYVFLFLFIISLFVFLVLLIGRVKQLESDVEELRKVVDAVKVLDTDVMNAIIGFEDEYDESETYQPNVASAENLSDYLDNYLDNYNANSQDAPEEQLQYESPSNLSEILRVARTKRNIIAATQDGVIINSESYAQKKAKNTTTRYTQKGHSVTAYPGRSSSIGSPWPIYPHSYHTTPGYGKPRKHSTKAPPLVYTRQSRVMHHEKPKKRQNVKKTFWKSGDTDSDMSDDTTTNSPDFFIVRENRRHRQRNSNLEILDEGHPRTGRIKPLPSVHYNGDTTKYVVGEHTNYMGNGHLRHRQATFVDWKASDWVESLGMDRHFNLSRGFVTIQESGLYFVYSQIYYLDEHDTTGYRVFKNDQMILQCTLTMHSVERKLKGNTCFTAGVEHFSEGDTLSLADITARMSLFEQGKSFFGVVKLGDMKMK